MLKEQNNPSGSNSLLAFKLSFVSNDDLVKNSKPKKESEDNHTKSNASESSHWNRSPVPVFLIGLHDDFRSVPEGGREPQNLQQPVESWWGGGAVKGSL